MKNIIYILIATFSLNGNAYVPQSNELVKIYSVITIEMNAIGSPIEGSFAINKNDKHRCQFDDANSQKLLQSKEGIKPLTSSYLMILEGDGCALINILTL